MNKTLSPQPNQDDTNKLYSLSVPDVLALMRDGEMELVQLMPWSSNYTFLAQISKGDVSTLAIYKPCRGERPLADFPSGTLYQREVAAFVVSDALGWNLVPPTIVREGEHGVGMVQQFVEHDPEEHFFTFRDPWPAELTRMALLDILINNADRKGGHCLRDAQGRIWGIDHGICFHQQYKLRTVIWEPAGQAIPPRLLNDLTTLQQALQKGHPPAQTLYPLLSPPEITAFQQRLAHLITSAHFPVPPPGRRHVPWPLL
ncbi:MAG: SCO1664 family protein [Ardenticatenaceae bacterium]